MFSPAYCTTKMKKANVFDKFLFKKSADVFISLLLKEAKQTFQQIFFKNIGNGVLRKNPLDVQEPTSLASDTPSAWSFGQASAGCAKRKQSGLLLVAVSE